MHRSLGKTIGERRQALGFSRGELARKLGIQSSHVGYIETDQRRPSLPLLKQMARVLGLNPGELFFLCHPEARELCPGFDKSKQPAAEKDAWEQFFSDRGLLRRYKITTSELKLLKEISLLSAVSHPRDCLFILGAIRLTAEPYT